MSRLRESRFSAAVLDPFAVEGMHACGAKGIAPHAGHGATDPHWQPG